MGPPDDEPFLDWAFRQRQVSGPGSDPVLTPDDDPDALADGVLTGPPIADAPTPKPSPPAPRGLGRFEQALVDEAMKKAGLIWVRTRLSPAGRALWYVWTAGNAYVVTGGVEQPDPGLDDGEVVVVLRSKDTTSRLVALSCEATRVGPEDDDWELASTELAKGRLNLAAAAEAPQRWREDPSYRIYRLSPGCETLLEGPQNHPTDSGRAAPVPTTATTASPRPWVLHRRGGSGRSLT